MTCKHSRDGSGGPQRYYLDAAGQGVPDVHGAGTIATNKDDPTMSLMLRSALSAALFLLAPISVMAQSTPTPAPAQSTAPAAGDTEKAPTARGIEPGKRGGRLAACRTDAATYCADAAKGGRRQCLRDNVAKLSPECQAALANVGGGKGKGRRAACRGDVQTVCAGVEKGKGAIGKCLRENIAKLSPACAATIEARKAKGKG